MSTIINLTPHEINVVLPDGTTRSFPPSGIVARVKTEEAHEGEVDGIPISTTRFGEVTFSDPAFDASQSLYEYFIVSRLVKQAVGDENSFLVPSTLIRDSEGRVIGCKGFSL